MAVKSVFGQIQEFDPSSELFTVYMERVNLFFTANDVPDEKKVPVFLTVVGKPTYALLRDLLQPSSPIDKTLQDITDVLKKHYQPTPSVIVERFQFHKRNQKEGESVAEYVAELKRLSTHCQFKDYLDDALRDRLVCGLRKESTQKRLLLEDKLTFTKAVETAQNIESVDKQTLEMKNGTVDRSCLVHQVTSSNSTCYRCGKLNHTASQCRYKDFDCLKCGKRGHLKVVCRSKGYRPQIGNSHSNETPRPRKNSFRPQRTKYIKEMEDKSDDQLSTENQDLALFTLGGEARRPIKVDVKIGDKPLTMEIDTGAAVSIVSKQEYDSKFSSYELRKSAVVLKTYTSESLEVAGEITVHVRYKDQEANLDLVVVQGEGPALLGRNWLNHLVLNWHDILHTSLGGGVDLLVSKYSKVFSNTLGTMSQYHAKLHLKPNTTPKFWRPRPVPFALKEGVEKELDRLQGTGIIEPIIFSEWAAPIVAVPKRDGSIRICGDYKVTLNQSLEVDQYPLPKPEELFASLSGGKKFTKLDLSQAYQQMVLDDQSKDLVTINTHKGLYRYTRMPFGIAPAPAIFQRTMDIVLQGIPRTICYIDDILITGVNDQEHLANLEEVLRRLQYHGITLKKNKCKFMCDSVEYLGYTVDSEGLHVTPNKIEAIVNAPQPQNVTELRAYLGLVNYYGKFIPHLASILQPLNSLLQKNCKWVWSEKCSEAVQEATEKLTSSTVLIHYNPSLPIRLAADASQYGIGTVLSHITPDGVEKPIAFASRTLSKAERNYSQIEKERLSLIFGVKKFNQYIYGREFTLITDHKPLTTIFGSHKGIPPITAARLQRWAILLSTYHYNIIFRSTTAHGNADGLSRLPLSVTQDESTQAEGASAIFNLSQIGILPVTCTELQTVTRNDPVLSKVLHYTRYGWPEEIADELKPYYNRSVSYV